MTNMKFKAWIVISSAAFSVACAEGNGSGAGTGGATATGGTAIASTGGTASTATGGAGTTTAGGTTSTSGGSGSTDTGSGGSSSSTTSCTPVTTGPQDEAQQWWAGDSEMDDAVVGEDNKSIADPTGIEGLDEWDGPTGWANISYNFGAGGACVDATGASTVSIDVTSQNAGDIRIALQTEATEETANHFQQTVTFTAGETKTVTLNLDGSGLSESWQGETAGTWDPAHLMSVVVIPLETDENGLAPYDIAADNVVVN